MACNACLLTYDVVNKEVPLMPGAGVGLFLIDFILRPFARIYQKMPMITFVIVCLLYGIIAYVVWRSAFKNNGEQQY